MRRSLAAFFLLLIVSPLIYYGLKFWHEKTRLSPGQDLVLINDYVKEALEFKRERSNSVAQLTILLLGALWALVIGSERQPRRLTWRSWLLLSCATISLGLSYLLYIWGIDSLIEYLFKAQTIDLYSPEVSLYSEFQITAFMIGIAYALVFALAFHLKQEEKRK